MRGFELPIQPLIPLWQDIRIAGIAEFGGHGIRWIR